MKKYFFIFAIILTTVVAAQEEKLPYYQLPENAEKFTAGTVAAKQVDALGFRFYWASEGLSDKDLAYRPTDSVRTSMETVKHIYDLSLIVLNSTLKKANSRNEKIEMNFQELRKQTLLNLKQAANILRTSTDISQYKIIFGDNKIPYWNNINGPISDAIWHCGQLASYRRITGNPINPKVNHFTGTVKK
ncbi:hypothetical protein [uncultured Lacinutrix sp.]|uniref:hypothetical protein n=1 Tax=uncultured Lacinutrix sp. TaxID=574032 RepID=UPI00260F47C4|nr:hypothetical protein [uncultured Lacinutrix sp.]